MFSRLIAIARVTFIETVRQPVYGVGLIATSLVLVLNVALSAFTFSDDNKLLLDIELSTLLLSGLFLAAFCATGVLTREIENKTVMTVVSKPVGRPLFLLGKFVGLFAALTLAFYIGFLVFVLCMRNGVFENTSDPWDAPVLVFGVGAVLVALVSAAFCNLFYGREFPTTAVGLTVVLLTIGVVLVAFFDEHFEPIPFASNFVGGQVIVAALLILLVLMVTTAVALAAATRFGQVMTLVICTVTIALGVMTDSLFGQYEAESRLAAWAYRAVPNIGVFWIIDGLIAESAETAVGGAYIALVGAYAVAWTVGILCVGLIAFQHREVG
ncbi:MAG: hypothetical protein IIB61_00345 [Planctomycetes bacterium]|nr:hypothetical protein [Planctomycetota bacterium]MCH8253375.1 hypothetical protein [Planctomycetota bacterium]